MDLTYDVMADQINLAWDKGPVTGLAFGECSSEPLGYIKAGNCLNS
jgi:hypothetical protein